MAQIDKVRILVLGDSGVGKTSLVHLICHNEPILNPYWTIGAGVEVKLHEYKAGMPAEKTYFVELWDIGGWSAHKNSRAVFYNPVHGLILCHDLTNKKSQQNLKKWLTEILNRDGKNIKDPNDLDGKEDDVLWAEQYDKSDTDFDEEGDDIYEYDPEQYAGAAIPMLVIGTKLDLIQASHVTTPSRGFNIAEECGADEIKLDCTCTKHLAPGTSNSVKLSRFFDKVIERKYYHNRDVTQVRFSTYTQKSYR
ncbi:hypothetical protein LSH36_594g01017 [Paralvinella palmiformis]|uniref:Rab-like protein 3 n=1 Tax=Paralvinella palmiformis TaxID=53620 RepID=A0AAD9J5N4_9ANNE|nr:hypothetical protein LSH36_594g01017 [Paralvinella palmiformis]